ncbi:hypothetical protein MHZ93_16545 [Roseomonas sp. ACRSG]|nr:hypothetical protein [Roseomonas sp. ACRSG]
MTIPPTYLSVKGAACEAAISTRGVYRLIADGAIRAVRLRGRTLIDGRTLRAHLDSLPDLVIRPERPAKRG